MIFLKDLLLDYKFGEMNSSGYDPRMLQIPMGEPPVEPEEFGYGLPIVPMGKPPIRPTPVEDVEPDNTVKVLAFGDDKYRVINNDFVVDDSYNFYGVAEGNNIRVATPAELTRAHVMGFSVATLNM